MLLIVTGGLLMTYGRTRRRAPQPGVQQPPPATQAAPETVRLLKGADEAVYQFTTAADGSALLRHIPTWADLVALGYEGASITVVEPSKLARYTLGPPLTTATAATPTTAELDPRNSVVAFTSDPSRATLWLGTRFAGLFACPWQAATALTAQALTTLDLTACQQFTTFNSALLDNAIQALLLDNEGALWIGSRSGVVQIEGATWRSTPLATGATTTGALALLQAQDGTIWVGGDGYIAWREGAESWRVHTAIDQPLLQDRFATLIEDESGVLWFDGEQGRLRVDGVTWRAYPRTAPTAVDFVLEPTPPTDVMAPPLAFPDPRREYNAWLQQWPRPAADNGRCLHFVQSSWLEVTTAQRHIDQLRQLDARWTVVPYANHFQLRRLAPRFAAAGIMVIWRPFIRPYERYEWWAEDIAYLRAWGIPPYLQLYNEPTLAQEWDDPDQPVDPPIDHEQYLTNLAAAIQEVYTAGGYVGLQSIDLTELRATLQGLRAAGVTGMFDRLFFVPHPYGLNHPPGYDEDESGVLGFLPFAQVFAEEIGFVPMMIAGEGGWRPGEAQDVRYPAITEAQHRDYHIETFQWFRTGKLSNGATLPDYLFAFCPWLLADPHDPAAWFESAAGHREQTIAGVKALSPFVRRFSWTHGND
jgi:hypothetical protein